MERRHAVTLGFTGGVKNRLCSICSKHFSETQVSLFQFFPDTSVCSTCYVRMSKDAATCFAKDYDAAHIDCFKYCPDRRVCRLWVEGPMPKIIRLGERNRHLALQFLQQNKVLKETSKKRRRKEKHPFTKGSIIRACFDKVHKGTTLDSLRAYCKSLGADFQLMFRKLRLEAASGYTWEWLEDDDGNIKIEFERQADEA